MTTLTFDAALNLLEQLTIGLVLHPNCGWMPLAR